ncbi:cytochrome C [Novosphingobium sp. 1949]|uniref:Cytochrome C n=1 Tax=Novosphingobium organovorum TaxID=2930092 RepID=A0ABT0BAS1_9SPHN|nr:cytochrome C [Novosphingobium organovorum]MCJ2182152.1 cytochrome C [Novosphingobium organovorum]
MGRRFGYAPLALAALVLVAAHGGAGFASHAEETLPTRRFTSGQSNYYEFCGGCHGLDGASARREIPVLKDHVGRFLCTPGGREYLVRLPNVAFAPMDDETLAQTLNFIARDLGGASYPAGARAYTAAEVGRLRQAPLKATDLAALRVHILEAGEKTCSAR